jgi:DNA adenine methylase
MKAPFGRIGGKSRIAEIIISYFPKDYKYYVEPFLGSGNIFFKIPLEEKIKHVNIISDLDNDIYKVMKGLQTKTKFINSNIKRENLDKEYFNQIKDKKDVLSLIEKYKITFFSQGLFYGNKIAIKTNFLPYYEHLKNVIILNKSYEKLIEDFDSPETFFYFDPPYSMSESKRYYSSISNVSPKDLFRHLRKIKGKFMLSYDDNDEIKELFKDYHINFIETSYANTQYIERRKKNEIIITNYYIRND